MVAHAFNPSTRDPEAGGSLRVQGHPSVQVEFQDSQVCYTEKLLSQKAKTKTWRMYVLHLGDKGVLTHCHSLFFFFWFLRQGFSV